MRVKAMRLAGRAPRRRAVARPAEANPPLVAAVGVHHIELLRSGAVAFEQYAAAVGREAGRGVDARRAGQPISADAVHVGDVDVAVAVAGHRESDAPAVRRESRGEAHRPSRHQRPLLAGGERHQIDLRHSAGVASVGQPLPVWRKARPQYRHRAPRQIRMVRPVPVHDRDPLDQRCSLAALGDVGDTRVEDAFLPGQPLVGGVGAAVRGAAPVGRRDEEALSAHLAPCRNVIDVAADGQTAVLARIDEAEQERPRTALLPFVEERRGRLGPRIGPHRFRC
jgi:hypothetical protein